MKNKYRIAAGVLCLLTAFIHLIGGQISLIDPLLESNLSNQVKAELVGAWHIVSIVLFYSSWILLKSPNSQHQSLVQFIGYCFVLFGIVFIGISTYFGLLAPQFILLIPIGIFACLGLSKYNHKVSTKQQNVYA